MSDYISREAAIEALGDVHPLDYNAQTYKHNIENLPAADVREVKRGKWEEVEVIWLVDIEDKPDAIASMFCPKCKRYANHVYHYGNPTDGMNFCPNCGAQMDMREEQT